MTKYFSTSVICILLLASFATAAETRVQARLISDAEIAVPGSTIRVGVLYTIPDRSHIYWRNSGDAGLPTHIEWDPALTVSELQWPAPEQFSIEGLDEAYFGYSNEVLLYADLTVPKDAPSNSAFTVRAKSTWLLCLDDGECIPEDTELNLVIRTGAEPRLAYEATVFDRFAETVPRWDAVPHDMEWLESEFTVILPISYGSFTEVALQPIQFFPYQGGGWTLDDVTGSTVTFRPDYKGDKPGPGVLILPTIDTNNGIPTTYYLTTPGPETP